MPPNAAAFLCVSFIAWLFLRDRRRGVRVSKSLWVPTLWVAVLMSRPVSQWFEGGRSTFDLDAYNAASAVDRNVFLLLEGLALVILMRRKIDWRRVFSENLWLFLFYLYCGVSVVW